MLDFIISTASATLQGLGIGSSGTLVIYLTLLRDMEQTRAQGINLIFFIFSAMAALLFHAGKRKIFYGTLAVLTLFGTVGAITGALILNVMDPLLIRKIFGGMLTLSGLLALFGKKKTFSDKFSKKS